MKMSRLPLWNGDTCAKPVRVLSYVGGSSGYKGPLDTKT